MARSPVSLPSWQSSRAARAASGRRQWGRGTGKLESVLVIAAIAMLLGVLISGRLSAIPARAEVAAHLSGRQASAVEDTLLFSSTGVLAKSPPGEVNWGPIIPLPSCPLTFGPIASFDLCQFVSEGVLSVY